MRSPVVGLVFCDICGKVLETPGRRVMVEGGPSFEELCRECIICITTSIKTVADTRHGVNTLSKDEVTKLIVEKISKGESTGKPTLKTRKFKEDSGKEIK